MAVQVSWRLVCRTTSRTGTRGPRLCTSQHPRESRAFEKGAGPVQEALPCHPRLGTNVTGVGRCGSSTMTPDMKHIRSSCLHQWTSAGSPKARSVVSGDLSGRHTGVGREGAPGIRQGEPRGAVKHPTMHRAPHNGEPSSPKGQQCQR